jgi:hypothetical protein
MTIKRPHDMPRHISKGAVEARNREKKKRKKRNQEK